MNRRFLALALAGTLTLGLLAGCSSSGNTETPAPESSAPVTETAPVETPTPAPETEPPVETPDAGNEETPAPESTQPVVKPTEQPVQTPSQAPSVEPTPVPSAPATGGVDLAAFYASLFTDPENTPSVTDLATMPEMLDAYYPGLSAIATKQCMVYMPNITAVPFEIALIEVANAADVDAVKAILQARIDNEVNNQMAYPMIIENWTSNSRIAVNGNYIMMVAYEECDAFVSSFNALF